MSEKRHPVLPAIAKNTHLDEASYRAWHKRSLDEPETFWAEQAEKFIDWSKPWNSVLTGGFEKLDYKWFDGGELNMSYNCLDRHLEKRKNQPAIIWEGDDPSQSKTITYQDLYEDVCRFANVLKSHGVKKGDRVCLYLPMVPEVAVVMLACTRIGAIHSVVFAGFSTEALKSRILDADCKIVVTANEGVRGNKKIPLKKSVDDALVDCPCVKTVIVVQCTKEKTIMNKDRDVWYHDEMKNADVVCEPEKMSATDPLFILYTSGSTGKPKGILHGTGGYAVYVAMTFHYVFDYQEGEIYWCSADVGWVTGHSYVVYGPLLNGATTVMFEGVPNYPTPARCWEIIDKHKVNIFYTAPTAIRALRREGDQFVKQTKRDSLRILGTVGEPINPEAWEWYYHIVGDNKCAVVDTWWQTETGGIMITPFPGATELKPGSASWPFFGIDASVVDDNGLDVGRNQMGKLVIKKPWPGILQTIYGDHDRFVKTYFSDVSGKYLASDQAHIDDEGYFWIAGRSDDVMNVSGHRIGTQEVESALITHHAVSEAAVVAIPDDIKGQAIYAYVNLKVGETSSDGLKDDLVRTVRTVIGPIATPKVIQWAEALPKTRSGKIMRRVLRKIAVKDTNNLGDLSTLADPTVVDALIKEREKL